MVRVFDVFFARLLLISTQLETSAYSANEEVSKFSSSLSSALVIPNYHSGYPNHRLVEIDAGMRCSNGYLWILRVTFRKKASVAVNVYEGVELGTVRARAISTLFSLPLTSYSIISNLSLSRR